MDKDIVKSNALIEACYQPASLWQMRLLPAALMQVKAGGRGHQKPQKKFTGRQYIEKNAWPGEIWDQARERLGA